MTVRSRNIPVGGWQNMFMSLVFSLFLAAFVAFVAILLLGNALYVNAEAVRTVFTAPYIRHALWMSAWTSTTTVAISLVFAVPVGYALSRYRFPGRTVADAIVDLPVVFPPLVAGLTLLVFFNQTALGRWIEAHWVQFVFQPQGIVLCQFFVAASYAIRAAKLAFDDVDQRLENVALTLGCTPWTAFLRVTLPLARNGILAGAILTWARAFGLFGPLLIFVGSFRGRTEVLSTTIFLEQSVGRLEVALVAALLLIGVALVTLVAVRLLTSARPGRLRSGVKR
jgi:molybdate transport system permease protein